MTKKECGLLFMLANHLLPVPVPLTLLTGEIARHALLAHFVDSQRLRPDPESRYARKLTVQLVITNLAIASIGAYMWGLPNLAGYMLVVWILIGWNRSIILTHRRAAIAFGIILYAITACRLITFEPAVIAAVNQTAFACISPIAELLRFRGSNVLGLALLPLASWMQPDNLQFAPDGILVGLPCLLMLRSLKTQPTAAWTRYSLVLYGASLLVMPVLQPSRIWGN